MTSAGFGGVEDIGTRDEISPRWRARWCHLGASMEPGVGGRQAGAFLPILTQAHDP